MSRLIAPPSLKPSRSQRIPTYNLSNTTRTAMQRYGTERCLKAYEFFTKDKSLPFIDACFGGVGIRSVVAMINAGREMVIGQREP